MIMADIFIIGLIYLPLIFNMLRIHGLEVLGGFGVQTDPKIQVILLFLDTVLRLKR